MAFCSQLKWRFCQFRKTKAACFLSYVEDRSNTNTSFIIYTFKYIQNMFPKVELLEETKGGGKEEKNDKLNYSEIHHICVGTRHKKTH
jgi:hypothetical protein